MPSSPQKPRLLTLLLVACSLGSLALAWHFHQQLSRQRREHEDVMAKVRHTYEQQLAKANTPKIAPTETDAEPGETPTPAAREKPASEGKDPQSVSRKEPGRGEDRSSGVRMTAIRELMNNPEVVKMMALQQKGELDGRYADLFKKLKLPPEKLDALKNLLVEQQSISRDVYMAARQEGMGREDRDEIAALIKVTRDENNSAIRGLLGDQAYNDYVDYNANSTQRRQVDRISDRLSYSEAPLTEKQSQQLVQALAQTTKTPAQNNPSLRPGGGFTGGMIEQNFSSGGGVTITNQVISQASTFMSAAQLQQLRQIQAEQQSQAQLQKTFSEAAKKNSGAGAKPKTPKTPTVTK